MEVLVALHRCHTCELTGLDLTVADINAGILPDRNTQVQESDSTVLHQFCRRHVTDTEVAQLLVGVFHPSDERAIVVASTILEDEAMPLVQSTTMHSQYRSWHAFQRVSPSMTRLRVFASTGPRCRNKVPIPIDEETAAWGMDVRATEKSLNEATLHHYIHTTARRCVDATLSRMEKLAIRFLTQMYGGAASQSGDQDVGDSNLHIDGTK
ncbi:Aste57867_1168 [Aphanomyces stellatus]|uniref:Aste57867_1168 protein n=1 Tax=Aphanomyces stellatus TaxID=120398 RepID=A0A485K5L0_9STRA|nr:hypothetical protein As57867_001167 [Aphanomyces stellatus]VFT78388.1 Aste57867_1168 [Aphanomyces stellatus]